jgi:plasmid maintenance system antidote protein VapI
MRAKPAARNDELPEQLRAAIESSNLSSYALAESSGVAEEVIRRFRNGTRDLKLETAGRIALALQLELTGRKGRRAIAGR